jgi:hypothetical protein
MTHAIAALIFSGEGFEYHFFLTRGTSPIEKFVFIDACNLTDHEVRLGLFRGVCVAKKYFITIFFQFGYCAK